MIKIDQKLLGLITSVFDRDEYVTIHHYHRLTIDHAAAVFNKPWPILPPICFFARRRRWAPAGPGLLITLATKDTEETLRDAQSCAQSRFENFLRDGGQHRLVYCGKGLDVVATAILKRNLKMLESGIDPATVRFEVGRPAYCKYSIFLLENGFYN